LHLDGDIVFDAEEDLVTTVLGGDDKLSPGAASKAVSWVGAML
jgi:hypothetical protein